MSVGAPCHPLCMSASSQALTLLGRGSGVAGWVRKKEGREGTEDCPARPPAGFECPNASLLGRPPDVRQSPLLPCLLFDPNIPPGFSTPRKRSFFVYFRSLKSP